MKITRRAFIRGGGLALVSFGVDPLFLARAALAEPAGSGGRRPVLVCLFQRGAVDGLSMLVPHADANYYRERKRIALPEREVIDLDGYFGLHPALADLEGVWRVGNLTAVPACGSLESTRSHFDAQDYMESGTPGSKNTRDGWLNRYADHEQAHWATPLRSVAFGAQLPRILAGNSPALAIPNLQAFGIRGRRQEVRDKITRAFEELYAEAATGVVAASAEEGFEAAAMLRRVSASKYRPANGAVYPQGRFGRTLSQIARLIRAEVGLEIAFADVGGWDTHVNQGAAKGQLSNRLREFGGSLAAFHRDLGGQMRDVVVLTMSEFGRTVAENGSGGTDHGHGTTMLVMGGKVAGGSIHGSWPGLAPEQLFEGRDVAVTTDFRDLFAEILVRHMGAGDLDTVFPGHGSVASRWPGVMES